MNHNEDAQDGAPSALEDVPSRVNGQERTDGAVRSSTVEVHCDYISADEPIHRAFANETLLGAVKLWARQEFVPNPPSDKAYYLNDDKTRHRFTAEEEQRTLAQLGYEHGAAHFRLNEEQASGA